jgi:predicted nucleotidyltransferase
MLRKRNEFEIVEALRKEPRHIRRLAQELKLVPSTAMRLLKSLQKENVVDFKREGKNCRYFLKDSLEAKSFLRMSEDHKLILALANPEIRFVYKQLISMTDSMIILFGSHAKGSATSASDIDIYVETSDLELKKKMELISAKLSVFYGPLDKNSVFFREIVKNHVIFQGAERFYRLAT